MVREKLTNKYIGDWTEDDEEPKQVTSVALSLQAAEKLSTESYNKL